MKKFERKNGFTLVEMLVSVAVIVLITGIFLANYRASSQRADLIFAAQQMASDIRLAENYSLGLVNYGEGNFPIGGWGFYIDKSNNKYYIFADVDGDKSYTASPSEADKTKSAKEVIFPANIVVDSIQYGANFETSSEVLNITFLPPDPTVYIVGTKYYNAKIVLKDVRNGLTKEIDINFFGLIEVK
ncbi:MAG: type II secretion system protein [Patescibacteria group bacterium]|nr:type II secretion system protein [Patescibacteria group bacterium]MDD4611269.1 type II secretion system protein [Patescibacteria group bacterium]